MAQFRNTSGLINPRTRPPDERRELARKAGIASGKARREKRDLIEKFRQQIYSHYNTKKLQL